MAAAFALTAPGRDVVLSIKPLKDISEIRQRIALISECRNLLSEGQYPGIEHFDDLSLLFQKVRPVDAVLEPLELRAFLPLFYSACNLKILSESPSYTGLGIIVSQLTTHPGIKKAIGRALDNEGKIRDEASPELFNIRRASSPVKAGSKGCSKEYYNRKRRSCIFRIFI